MARFKAWAFYSGSEPDICDRHEVDAADAAECAAAEIEWDGRDFMVIAVRDEDGGLSIFDVERELVETYCVGDEWSAERVAEAEKARAGEVR